MPSWYFGFHFMLPFHHHKAIPDSIVTELRSIFQDIHTNGANSLAKQQARYERVITSMKLQCIKLCKKSIMTPHPIFKVNQSFCEALRPKMLRWYQYLSIIPPNLDAFVVDLDDTDDIEKFEANLSRMGLAILASFECIIKEIPQGDVEFVNAALEILADLSSTFELKLLTRSFARAFRARVESVLSLYLQVALKPFNRGTTSSDESEYQHTVPLEHMRSFFVCRYTQFLSFTECAPLILEFKKSSLSLIDLAYQIHRVQILLPESARFTQRFLRFILEGLINEMDSSLPLALNSNLKEHLLQKIPVLGSVTSKEDYVDNRLTWSERLLPSIFSDFLEAKHGHVHESFALHYTVFDVDRLLKKNKTFDISAELLTFDTGDKNSFSEIYTKFIKIIQQKGYFFKSLYHDYDNVLLAICFFLEELAGYEDFQEMLECILNLIDLYEKENFLEKDHVTFLKGAADVWFNPDYLKDCRSRQRPKQIEL